MQKFKSGAEAVLAAALAVRTAKQEHLTHGEFVNSKGCLCAVGHVVYNDSPEIKAAVDGLRALAKADMFDQDLLDIIANRLDTEAGVYWEEMVSGIFYKEELTPIFTRFDSSFKVYGSREIAARSLEALLIHD